MSRLPIHYGYESKHGYISTLCNKGLYIYNKRGVPYRKNARAYRTDWNKNNVTCKRCLKELQKGTNDNAQ